MASPTRTPAFSTMSSARRPTWCASICPPDANCLLSVFDHCLRSRHYVNVVVAGKHALPQWLTMEQAVDSLHAGHRHLAMGEQRPRTREPDVVMACCGDTPTLEVLAAVSILRENLPDVKIRVVNVVDLMRLQPSDRTSAWPQRNRLRLAVHDETSRSSSTFHGYPALVHGLTYRRF